MKTDIYSNNILKKKQYGKSYFEYQDPIGKKTIRLKDRFQSQISNDSTVLDFGCGAGYLLAALECKNKIGLDINEIALREASKKGIRTFSDINSIKNSTIDCIISHSTLGHLTNPFEILNELKQKLKPNGIIIFSVPHETLNWQYKPFDINISLGLQWQLGTYFQK
ncbi:class I SAM-dependent methyltransferase [Flavobacteriaceae bacterium]|nr:class I SAM-dependent methyltransferase [Flavobacteriaceae bacterium]